MAKTTKEFYKGISQCFLCISIFILQNTNRSIRSIINEILTIFRLMKRFEMTVINKCMLFPTAVFNRLDITCTYENSIIHSSQNTGCTPGYSLYSRYWSHLNNISHTWGIFYLIYICIFHFSRRALSVQFLLVNIFSNPGGIINNSIL